MKILWAGATLSFALLASAAALTAQTHSASFTGIITSRDGNPLPNVEVTATNVATQVTYTARSNDEGLYTISALPIGTYTIRTQAHALRPFADRTRAETAISLNRPVLGPAFGQLRALARGR